MRDRPSAGEVAAAADAWLWIPDTATSVRTERFHLVRFPDWFDHPLVLVDLTPDDGGPTAALEQALSRSRAFGLDTLTVRARLSAPPGLEELLVGRGGVLVETLDVLARLLHRWDAAILDVPDDVEIRWVDDLDTQRDAERVGTEVFGGMLPPDAELDRSASESAASRVAGRGGSVVGYLDGRAAGAAGLTVGDDGTARLWGGSVLPSYRGKGVYRALLAARLDHAADLGRSLALVKGRVETSSAVLRHAGFHPYGRERTYTLAL